MNHQPGSSCSFTRRGFLLGAGTGLAVGTGLAWLGLKGLHASRQPAAPLFSGRSVETPRPESAMPGPFPGRVVEVHHPASVAADNRISRPAVLSMMDRGMRELTGADHASEAWKRFFEPGDVVGIKVNPVGRAYRSSQVASISSPAVVLQVVEGLKSAGVRPRDIILFERYADQFRDAGYENLLYERSLAGVRWFASSARYDDSQLSIDGHDAHTRRDGDPHVVGYDPDVFVDMGFTATADRKDDRGFRSHLSLIVTQMVNKIVTLPVLKDHRSAGVTLALKNMSHGMNNNVARSHLPGVRRRDNALSGPNQCNTFIPTAVSQPLLRQKAILHIMDGLIGVYDGGPACRNTWAHRALFFATDPVALDHVGWSIIDAKRVQEGFAPVAQTGAVHITPGMTVSTGLTSVGGAGPLEALTLAAAGRDLRANRQTEVFDRREPEHVILAGSLGLGVFEAQQIEHRRINLPPGADAECCCM